jgi:hypothetical protein
VTVHAISLNRFNARASYCRLPETALFATEVAWYESDDGRILATVAIDTDLEFHSIILAQDSSERFRAISVTEGVASLHQAVLEMHRRVELVNGDLGPLRIQGDEVGDRVDFFEPRVAQHKLHPMFQRLAFGDDFVAARSIINAMMRWYDDVDGNFIEQFQTTGFDARVWELYLFAALVESGLQVTRPKPAPDLLARGITEQFALEATTIGATQGASGLTQAPPIPTTPEEFEMYQRHYLPTRYAGPLTGKLRKRYWKHPSVQGKPLVFAIQDFHAPLSMRYSFPALPIYLYGLIHTVREDDTGPLIVEAAPISEHRWGTKAVAAGFFNLPDSENVSAVVFNNAGTLNKFNRMGVAAGFGSDRITLIRRGTAWDPNPNALKPLTFEYVVRDGSSETWVEGMDVFHNPNAIYPLDQSVLPGAAHHVLLPDQRIETTSRSWKPMESGTEIRRSERL